MQEFRTTRLIILLFICFQNSHCNLFTRRYAGSKTALDCLNGNRNPSNKLQRTTDETIEDNGYKAETHLVLSSDGYLLPLFRIPGPKGSPAILLQHGLSLNSWYWTATGKYEALPFFLADLGYDVWLGNFRGTIYSRCHVNLTEYDSKYWDFSYHEMGLYDLPAIVDYISNFKNDKIQYVGHSMGCTAFFVFAIVRPDVASKIKIAHSLGPASFLKNIRGLPVPFFDTVSYWVPVAQLIIGDNLLRLAENNIVRYLLYDIYCGLPITRRICEFILFSAVGFDGPQLNITKLPEYFNHVPSGASAKTVYHYTQVRDSGNFQYYDYGSKQNLILYNSAVPPNYNFSKIQVPMALYKGANDFYVNLKDADYLADLLAPSLVFDYLVKYPSFNHIDFVQATQAKELVYKPLLSMIEKYQ